MIYFIDEIEGYWFGVSFIINFMVLGPLMAISISLIYRKVKPESASLIININITATILIMSIISYSNGLIQDSCGQFTDRGTYFVFLFNFGITLSIAIFFTCCFIYKDFDI